jgi:hypothetical protein
MPYVEYDEVEAICSDCGRTFRSEEALEAHRLESHPPAVAPPSPPPAKRGRAGGHRPVAKAAARDG